MKVIITYEMQIFRNWLDKQGIEWHDFSQAWPHGKYICRTKCYMPNGDTVSVVNGFGTHGGFDIMCPRNMGLLEALIGKDSDPEGFLTAKELIRILKERCMHD